jgi:hypothetical protein
MQQEPIIRMAMLLGVLAIMATWEWVAPRRALSVSKAYRWSNNFGVIALGTLLTRLVVPAGAVGLGQSLWKVRVGGCCKSSTCRCG